MSKSTRRTLRRACLHLIIVLGLLVPPAAQPYDLVSHVPNAEAAPISSPDAGPGNPPAGPPGPWTIDATGAAITAYSRLDPVVRQSIRPMPSPSLAIPLPPSLRAPDPPILPNAPITAPVAAGLRDAREPETPYVAPRLQDTTDTGLRYYDDILVAGLPRLVPAEGLFEPKRGGSVRSGTVRLTVPAAAAARDLRLRLDSPRSYPRLRMGIRPHLMFTIDLADPATGAAVHALDRPAELRVNVPQLLGTPVLSGTLDLYHFDETGRYWERVPSHREGDDLVASVSRFSEFGLGSDIGQDWKPSARAQAGDSDLFTGSASFAMPLVVPKGTNGMEPKLTLSYSSLAPDQMNDALARRDGPLDNESPATQADWVGMGWSLGLGRITSSIKVWETYEMPEYSIELNGTREKLICVSGASCSDWGQSPHEFKTERDSYLRIIRRNDAPTRHGYYFDVWDKSGNYYRFGYNPDSEHLRGQNHHPTAWGLSLDLVEDTSGNRMAVEYFEDRHRLGIDDPDWYYDRAAFPARVRYTYNTAGFGSGVFQREVRFNEHLWVGGDPLDWGTAANRTDYTLAAENGSTYYYVQRYKLDEMASYLKLSGAYQPFRKYTFAYDYATPAWQNYAREGYTVNPQPKIRLKEIREWAGPSFATPLYDGAPTYSFGYDNPRFQMSRADTALSGSVDYSYQAYQTDVNPPEIDRYHVITRTLSPGSGLDPAISFTYAYSPGRYDEPNQRFIGHDWVWNKDGAYNATIHYFFAKTDVNDSFTGIVKPAGDMAWLRGREYRQDSVFAYTDGTPNGNGTKRVVASHYELAGTGDAKAVQLAKAVTYLDPGLGSYGLKDVRGYAYDSYGNVSRELECPGRTSDVNDPCDDAGGFSRRTLRWFGYLNAADPSGPGGYRYIVDRVTMEGVDGPGQWYPKMTLSSYDTDAPNAGPLDKGRLRWTRRAECYGCNPDTTADTKIDYDAFGNVVGTTTYDQFGQTTPANLPGQGRARTVQTEYDGQLKTFVTRRTQPGGLVWEEAGYDDLALRRQGPLWVRDSNDGNGGDTKTWYEHDDFGRLRKVARPGDTLAAPTTAYDYVLLPSAPKWLVKTTQRLDAGRVMVSRTFVDGLGRVVLTKKPAPDGQAGQAAAVASFYEEGRGLLSAETLPYATGDGDSFARPGPYESPRRVYEYDQFGQKVVTTRPDGAADVGTLVAGQRLGYAAQRGAGLAVPNASFETPSQATHPCKDANGQNRDLILPAAWTYWAVWAQNGGQPVADNTCVQRAWNGQEGRFALSLSSGAGPMADQAKVDNTWALSSSDAVAASGDTVYTLSWLGRGFLGTGKVRLYVKEYDAALQDIVWRSPADATANEMTWGQWKLYHFAFQTNPNTRYLAFMFLAGNGGYTLNNVTYNGAGVDLDGLRLTAGPVTERSEKSDDLGRLARVEERQGIYDRIKTDYGYDLLDRRTSVSDHVGNLTTYTYRTRFRYRDEHDPDRGDWTVEFDPNGNLKQQTDARGQRIVFAYDDLDRLTQKSYPDDPSTPAVTISYDDATSGLNRKGRRSWMLYPDTQNQVAYAYDARGRLASEIRVVDGSYYETRYSYNAADQVTAQTYPDQEAVSFGYEASGLLTTVSGASNYLSSMNYDLQGRPLAVGLSNGATSNYSYNPTTQRLSELRTTVLQGGVPVDDSRLTYGYDIFGNVTATGDLSNPAENRAYAYDNLNRLTQIVSAGPFTQTMSYDPLGNIGWLDGQAYGYSAGKPHAVSHLGIGTPARFGYDAAGNMVTRGSATLGYDAEGRLRSVSRAGGSEQYRYDGDGVLYHRQSAPPAGGVQFSDSFSSLDQQSWVYAPARQSAPYESGGRQTLRSTGTGSDWSGTFYRQGYPLSDGQVASFSFQLEAGTSQPIFALESGGDYGQDGYQRFALLVDGGKLYLQVVHKDQVLWPVVLTDSVQSGVWYRAELEVDDASGLRASVRVEGSPSARWEARYEMPAGKQWRFHHWVWAGAVQFDDYEEARPGGTVQSVVSIGRHYEKELQSQTVTKRYYAGSRLLATRTGAVLRYVQPDHLGSAATITDQSGVVVGRDRYRAFGERRWVEDPSSTEYLYTGQRFNALVGLYHYSDGTSAGRFYDATLGRFVSPDSIIPDYKSTQALNRYSYVLNNPLRLTDPSGHVVRDDTGLDDPIFDPPADPDYGQEGVTSEPALFNWVLIFVGDLGWFWVLVTPPAPDLGQAIGFPGPDEESAGPTVYKLGDDGDEGPTLKVGDQVITSEKADADAEPKGGTYLLRDPETQEVVRTGRSKDLERREGELGRDPVLGKLHFDVDKRTDRYEQQRGREQIIHDEYKPRLNKINPISPRNPMREQYMRAGLQV